MITYLNSLDTKLFLYLNSLHHPLLDNFMLTLSYDYYLFFTLLFIISIYGTITLRKWYPIAFIFCLISFGLSDRISSGFFKPTFERPRPCHNPSLSAKVYLAGKNCGGGIYGFVSSHAANSFSIAMFFFLLFRRKKIFYGLFIYASLVSYSRIYLARHYPGDIFAGLILGLLCGGVTYFLFNLLRRRFPNQ